MIRLLGAITGSALALATLLVVVGIPQFKVESSEIDRNVMKLPLPTSPVEATDRAAPEPAQSIIADVPASEPAAELEAPDLTALAEVEADGQVAGDDAVGPEQPEELPDRVASPIEAPVSAFETQNWYAFWSPFRSEIAASGFVEQLQRVTGLDYRVVKIKPGVYEVAFAYSEDTDISDNLSQITAATGLKMPEY